MKKALLVLLVLISTISVFAQTFIINGIITDKNNSPLLGANAILLNLKDSSFIVGAAVNSVGFFEIKNIKSGKYLFKTTCVGSEDKFKKIEVVNSNLNLGVIQLPDKVIAIKGVQIQSQAPPASLDGDTASYSSKAFKTNPDASAEDLVAKIPGVIIDGGKVQAQGEDVKKVLVDGKPFFGDDPSAVLRNLPSEMIDKVQIFDERSEQTKFTGFDDGNSSKTMNIVTRPGFRNGTFGKFAAMYGDEEKYKASSVLNFFKNEQRTTILAQSNNINEQNFSPEDIVGAIGGGGNQPPGGVGMQFRGGGGSGQRHSVGFGGGGDIGQFLVDQKNGLSKTNALGINFSDKWFNKIDLSGSYFLNSTNNNTTSDLSRKYLSTGGNYNEQSFLSSTNINHRVSFKIDYKIDSMQSILIQPRLTAQQNDGSSLLLGDYSGINIYSSNASNNINSDLTGLNFSASTLYRYKFNKIGRTFSININPQFSKTSGNSINQNKIKYPSNAILPDSIDQSAVLEKSGTSFSTNITYTEPITTGHSILFRLENSLRENFSDKKTNNFSGEKNSYSNLDSTLTNNFNSKTETNGAGVDYQFQKDNLTFFSGITFQSAWLNKEHIFPLNNLTKENFQSVLPNAMLTYRFTKEASLRLQYRASTNIPTTDQLQNVLDNSKPLQLSIGNPNLKQEIEQSINLRFTNINPGANSTFFIFLRASSLNNYIGNSTILLPKDTTFGGNILIPGGTRFYSPVNLNEQFSLRSFIMYGFQVPMIRSNLNLSLSANFTKTPGLINDKINFSSTPSYKFGFVLSSGVSEQLDFMVSSNLSYNITNNSLQTDLNSTYTNLSNRFKINVLPWEGLVFSTDLNHQANKGLSGDYNNNYILWNASIGYKFLPNKQAEIRFAVNDILNQNNSVQRNITESYFEDVRNNTLQRYFLLSFSYNLRSFAGAEGGFRGRMRE